MIARRIDLRLGPPNLRFRLGQPVFSRASVEDGPVEAQCHSAGQISNMPRGGVFLEQIQRFANTGHVCLQVRSLIDGAIDDQFNRLADRFRGGYLAERLHADHRGRRRSQNGCEIAPRDLLSSQHRLEIVLSLSSRAPGFQHVWQRGQTVFQALFGGLLNRVRIG